MKTMWLRSWSIDPKPGCIAETLAQLFRSLDRLLSIRLA